MPHRQIIVLVTAGGGTVAEFRDVVHRSTVVVAPVLPRGVALAQLALRIGPHQRRHGAAATAYLRTPTTCPRSGHWTTGATFTYADGTRQSATSRTPCAP